MRSIHLIGLLLWRGGLLLVGAVAFFYAARTIYRFFNVSLQVEIGLGLVTAGAAFIMISLIMERVVDARAEGNLRE